MANWEKLIKRLKEIHNMKIGVQDKVKLNYEAHNKYGYKQNKKKIIEQV